MEKDNICLIIIFNHRYDKNIDKLNAIYNKRFANIFYLVPFYDGNIQNVIPVYESSFYFQGHIAQSFNRFFDEKYSHYFFLADDLILNPVLNSQNIKEKLHLNNSTSYIKNLSALSDIYFLWIYLTKTLECFNKVGFDYNKELPNKHEAIEKFKKYGLKINDLSYKQLKNWNGKIRFLDFIIYKGFWKQILYLRRKRQLTYPLLAGYSDFVVIPSNSIKEFCRLCGVFAAMNLWVEVAIPTAIALSSKEIITELKIGENWVTGISELRDELWKGTELWDNSSIKTLEETNDYDLQKLFNSFKQNELYIHPVKLSKWKADNI